MRTIDLSPLYRFSVGFDAMDRLFDAVARWDETAAAYPPYNIVKLDDDEYRITMAVAGFAKDDLTVTVERNSLTVTGRRDDDKGEGEVLYRGIAARAFERKFELADYIRVVGSTLHDGVLSIELKRELPEAMKPHAIPISVRPAKAPKTIEGKKAA